MKNNHRIEELLSRRPDIRLALRLNPATPCINTTKLPSLIEELMTMKIGAADLRFVAVNHPTPLVRVAVIGKKLSGKSTAAKFIGGQLTPLVPVVDTSDVLYKVMAERTGTDEFELRTRPKEEIRSELIRIGDELTASNPLFIIPEDLLHREFVVAGIRTSDQLEALRHKCPNVKVLWIDRESHDPDQNDNLALTPQDADIVVKNNGFSFDPFYQEILSCLMQVYAR